MQSVVLCGVTEIDFHKIKPEALKLTNKSVNPKFLEVM